MACLFELGVLLPAIPLCYFLKRPLFADGQLTMMAVGQGILASLPMLVGFALLLNASWGPFQRIQDVLDTFLDRLFAGVPLAGLALISIAAGIGEETLFRGAVQGILSDSFHPYLGLAVASLLFGLCHFVTPTYAIIATAIGLYLGWVWNLSGNLVVPITAHAFYDFVALALYRKLKHPSRSSMV